MPLSPSRLTSRSVRQEFAWCLRSCRAQRVRSMGRFMEEEMVLPKGKYAGRRYRFHRQPYARLAYDEIDSGRWTRFAFTGCVQSGKSLQFFVNPILYTICELGEPCVVGVSDMNLAWSKWSEEIWPVMQRTRYASLMPEGGRGSRGGKFEEVKFRNGATLKFMSGQGSDAKRSSFTARVVVATEVDKYDVAKGASREADPVSQMEARTASYDFLERRFFQECTVSIEEGRIWTEYTNGTQSRIMNRCPICRAWVAPEREHLVGWDGAADELEAHEKSHFVCPDCAEPWTADQRRQMQADGRLVHRGQEIDPDGVVHGPPPRTTTLGFRWNAFHNLFWSPGAIGIKEWRAAQGDEDEEDQKKELSQFYWVIPFRPMFTDLAPLTSRDVQRRVWELPRGQVPRGTLYLTCGVDIGKRVAHWVVVAFLESGRCHVVDYGIFEIEADRLGVQRATLVALRDFRDRCLEPGWTHQDGGTASPQQIWIDSGWFESQLSIYAFCREPASRDLCRPIKGFGSSQQKDKTYRAPSKKTNEIRFIGDQFHFARQREHRIDLVHVNADFWKARVHERLRVPQEAPEALTLFRATEKDHLRFGKHLTAERGREVLVPGRPPQIVFEQISAQNHWLDAIAYANAAGCYCALIKIVKAAQQGGWFARQQKRRGG